MASVFLSYARGDRDFAAQLARVLEKAGHSLWWDRQLDGGEEFSEEIEAALADAEAVVVAWSAHAVKSRWVRDEASIAGDTGRLVPVTIDGSPPPIGFRQFHTLDLSGWKGGKRDRRTTELLQSIERRLNPKPNATQPLKPPAPPPLPRSRRALWAGVAAALLLVAAASAIFLSHRQKSRAGTATPTIGLVPFTTASSDPQLQALAQQARDSLTHSFSQSGVPLQLMSSLPQDSASAPDYVLSGDLSRTGEKVVAAVRLDEGAHAVTVFSHQFEAAGDDVPNLADRIGAQLAGDLTWAAPLMVLEQGSALGPAMTADLLRGYDFASGILAAYQSAKRVAAKAPNVQIAQVALAFDTAFTLDQIPLDERIQAVTEARAAADRAIKLGPGFGDTYAAWCLLHSNALVAECESKLRAGRRIDPDAPFLNSFLAGLLRNVGRFDEAADLARLSYTHDPYVPTKIGWMLLAAEYQGDDDGSREIYQQSIRWWPEFRDLFFEDRLRALIERGDFDGIGRLEKEVGPNGLPSDYRDSGILSVDWKSRPAVQGFCSRTQLFLGKTRCVVELARLGDMDAAYAIADKFYPRRLGRTPAETEQIWLDDPEGYGWPEFITSPAAAPLRRDPRYLALVQRIGLLAYWRSVGPPDFCRKQPEPVCRQLLGRG